MLCIPQVALALFVAFCLLTTATPVAADTFSDWWCFHIWDRGGDPSGWYGPQYYGGKIYYQVILTTNINSDGAGHLKFERDSWAKQLAANSGGFTVTPDNSVEFNGNVRLGGTDWSCSNPDDIWISSMESTKAYVINVMDSGSVLADTCNDSMAAFAVNEVNHRNALVTLGTLRMTNDATGAYLYTGSSAESAGSCEEIWIQWTTNNFTSKGFIQLTGITANTSVKLVMTNQVQVGSPLRWLAITTSGSDTSTISGTTSGVGNFDAGAINRSAGVHSSGIIPAATDDEIVEQFIYDSGLTLGDSLNGGHGWTNSWGNPWGTLTIDAGNLVAATNYPDPLANKIKGAPGINGSAGGERHFSTFTTGTFYLGWVMNVGSPGTERYAGFDIKDTEGSTRFMVGLPGNRTVLAAQRASDSVTDDSAYTITGGQDYTIIAKYDFSTHTVSIIGYYINTAIPLTEPTTWAASLDLGAGYVTNINRISLTCGGWGTTYDIGDVFYDEIRVAKSWGDLLNSVSYVWDATAYPDRDWSTAANWEGDTEPVAPQHAYINGAHTGEVTAAGAVARDLYVGSTDAGALEQSGGTLTITNLYVGGNASTEGRVTLTGGSLNIDNQVYLSDGSVNGVGNLIITGGKLRSSEDIFVGRDGIGLMVVSGTSTATLRDATAHLYIGDLSDNDKDNQVQVDGNGVLDVGGNIELGDGPRTYGALVVSGGLVQVSGDIKVGDDDEATGTVSVVGGILDVPGNYIYLGDSGYGSMTIGGGAVTSGTILVGSEATAEGHLTVTNGTLDVTGSDDLRVSVLGSGDMVVGGAGVVTVGDNIEVGDGAGLLGTLDMDGGRIQVDNGLVIGDPATGTGVVTVIGGSIDAVTIYAGNAGEGHLNIGGGAVTSDCLRIATWTGSDGIVTITNGSLDITEATDLIVAENGTGILNIGGTADVNVGDGSGETELRLGTAGNGQGTVNQSNGTVTIVEDLRVGVVASPADTYNLLGGTLDVNDDVYLGDAAAGATGILNAVAGTLTAGTLFAGNNGDGFMTVDGATVTFDDAQVGVIAGADGVLAIVDGSVDVTAAGDLQVGVNGTGILNIDGTGELNVGDNSGETDFMLGVAATGYGVVNQSNGTVTIDSGTGDSILKIGIASGAYGEYNISGGILDIEDHIFLGDAGGGVGTFHVIGDSATITPDNDFTINNASSTLKVSFVSSQLSTIEVGDDIVLNGALTIDDDGSMSSGSYTIMTSVNNSAISGNFAATNWLGSRVGTVSYDDGAVVVSFVSPAPIWDGGGGDANWDTAGNWQGDVVPAVETNVEFYTGIGSGTAISLNGNRSVSSLTFNASADTALTISSDTLTIGGGGISVDADAAGAHTIASAVALDDPQEWENLAAVSFSVSGVVSGSNPLRKKGGGIIRLMNAANTLDGGLWIDEGVLYSSGAQGFGLGPINVGTNAQFAVDGGALSTWAYFTPMTVNVYGAGTSWTNPSIKKTSGGRWSAEVNLFTNAGINFSFAYGNGCVFDLNGHTLYHEGNLDMESGSILGGTKTDGDGALYIQSGRLQLAGHSTLTGSVTVNTNSTLRLLAGASLPAGGVLHFGTNALFDQKTTSDGPFRNYKHTEIAGKLNLGGSLRGRPYMYGTVDLLGGVREIKTSDSSSYDVSAFFYNSISNGGIIKTGSNNLFLLGTNTFTLGLSVYEGKVSAASYALPGSVYLSNDCFAVLSQSVTGTLAGPVSGLGKITKLGVGEVVVTGNNSYSGETYVSNGVWIIEHANALGTVAGETVVSDGATLGMRGGITSAAEPLSLAGTGYGSVGALYNESGINTFSGPVTLVAHSRFGADDGELIVSDDITGDGFNIAVTGAGRVRLNGSLDLMATGAVSMAGSGFLFLGGDSTNSGGAAVSSGTLVQNGTNTVAPVNVSAGAALMGCGSAGAADVSGTLCPGADTNSIDSLELTSMTMRNGSSLQILIGDCDNTADRGYVVNGSVPTIESTVLVKPDSSLVSNWDASVSNDWIIISGNISSTSGFSIDTSLWDTGTYALNSGTFGLAENGGNLVLHFAPAPPVDISVRGTNLAEIVDGDASPQLADGTDFESVVAARDVKDHTFYITNSGLADLTISSVTTTGTHMAEFIILDWPSVVSPGGVASNLVIRFEPSAAGVRTATLHVNNNDPDEADYDFAVQGTGLVLVGPYVTNCVAGVTNQVTDGQMISGVFTVMMNICDADGINTTDSANPHFIPSFSIWNPVGVQVLTDEVFSAFTHAASGQEVEAVDTAHAGVSYAANILGTFTNWFSAENSNDVTTVDLDDDTDGNSLIFTVVDDDDAAPVLGHFASNLIANAGFETGDFTGWDPVGSGFDVDGSAAESGSYGLWITNFNGTTVEFVQHMILETSTTYRMYCRARKVGTMDPMVVAIKARLEFGMFTTEFATNNFVSSLSTNWQTFELEFTTDATHTNYGCLVNVINNFTGSHEGRAEFDAIYVGLTDDPAPVRLVSGVDPLTCTNPAIIGTTNAIYRINDYRFRNQASWPLYMKFAAYDSGSGISRGTTDPTTQMNITVYNPVSGSYWKSNSCVQYYASYSSDIADTFNDGASSVWRNASSLAYDLVAGAMGTNVIRVTIPDADDDRAGDRLTLADVQVGYLDVYDDDAEPPQVTSNVFGRPMGVCLGTNWLTPTPDVDTTNAVYYINRDDLVNTNPFILVFSAYDLTNGLRRETSGDYTNLMNVSIGTAIVHNLSNFDSSRSTASGTASYSTSTWTWASMSGQDVLNMVGTNQVKVSLYDSDWDWGVGDVAADVDHIFGTIIVTNSATADDDITPPILKPITYGDNLVTNGGFEYGYAGWTRSGLWSMGDYASQTGTNGAAQGQGSYSYLRYDLPTNVPYRAPVSVTANFRRDPGATTNARLRIRVQSGTRYVEDQLSSSWTQVGHTSSVTVASSYFYLDNYSPYVAASTVYWDNVEARIVYGAMRVWVGDDEIGSYYSGQTDGYFSLYDQQLAEAGTDPLRLVFYAYDPESGLSRGTTDSDTQMNITIRNWLTNDCSHYYETGSSLFVDTFSSGASSVWRFTSFDRDMIHMMVTSSLMYVTSSIPNADFDTGEDDREWLRDQQLGRLYVTDDDTVNPQRTYFTSPFRTYVLMYSNSTLVANNGATYGSTEYNPTDGFLANISPAQPFDLIVRARDLYSGLSRTNSAADPDAYCNISIPYLVTNDLAHYDASLSAPFEETFAYATNGWRWTTPFSPEQIEGLFQAGAEAITFHMADADDDWDGDYRYYDSALNYIAVTDDDTTGPECSGFVAQGAPGISTVAVYEIVGGGWSVTGLVRDTNSGINVNGGVMSDSANNISPYFTVKNSTGAVIIAGEVFGTTEGDGCGLGTTFASIGSANVSTPVDAGEACLGIYTVTVICADNDEDRTYDRFVTTNVVATFEVVDFDKVIIVDGNTNDWVGVWPDTVNASTYSSGEFIWRDKEYDERLDPSAPANQDIYELRMTANSSNLFFMVRFQDITDFAHPYIAIGVDTNQDPADTAQNWIGDDANTTMGDGYYTNGNAAMHYPDVQIIVHNIDGVGQRIELYDPSGDFQWEAPSAYAGTSTTWSAANDVMEFVIPRADLGLTGSVTGRFTVASYQNAQVWANAGDSTTNYTTSDAVDSLSIMPFSFNDSNLSHTAWDEDISDGDIDFYVDVRFNGDGIVGDNAPTAPVVVSPLGGSVIEHGVGPFEWQPSTDTDDEVTSYLLEVSTNATFNGGENGTIMARYNIGLTNLSVRVDEMSGSGATQFYWRVRSRDLSGVLSPVSGPYMFQTTTTDSDTEGPEAALLYVGTNYTPSAAVKTELYDCELADTNNPIDIAVMLTDPSGVFLTNHPPHPSTNIISDQGRVIPNWDVLESNTLTGVTITHGHDVCFSNFYGFNGAVSITAYQHQALSVTNIDLNKQYYLTVSAEDEDNNRGLTADPQGDGDPIPADRMVRTNYLMSFSILDDDTNAPTVSGSFYTNRYLQDPGFEMSNTVWAACCQSYNAAVRYSPTLADSGDHYGWLDGAGSWYESLTDTNKYPVNQTSRYVVCFRARLNSGTLSSGTACLRLNFYTNDASLANYHVGAEDFLVTTNLTDSYGTFVYMFQPLYENSKVSIQFRTVGFSGNSVYWDNAAFGLVDDLDWAYRVQLGTEHKQGAYEASSKKLVYSVTDGELADVSAVNPFRLHLKAFDVQSGLARDVTGLLSSQMCVSVENLTVNNTTNMQIGECSVDSTTPACTNVWTWEHLEESVIQDMFVTGQNEVSAVLYDADDDRVDDQTVATNSYGYLLVTDDDTMAPGLFGPNELVNGDLELGGLTWWFRNTGNVGVLDDSDFAHNGEKYLYTRNCATTFESSWTYVDNPTPEATYIFSVWCKASPDYTNTGANAYFKAEICHNLSAWPACVSYGKEVSIFNHITTNWQQFSMTITTRADTIQFRAVVGWNFSSGSDTGTLYWDDLYVAECMEPFRIAIGDTELEPAFYIGTTSPTNLLYEVTDEQLASITPSTPFKLLLGMQDESLVSRGTDNAATQMNVSVDNMFTNNVANYRPSLSTSNEGTRTLYASNVWTKTSFAGSYITELLYTTSRVSATAYDLDADRGFQDVLSVSNQQYGFISFIDDDTNYPAIGGNILRNGDMEDGSTGWSGGTLYTSGGNPDSTRRAAHNQADNWSYSYVDSTTIPIHRLPLELTLDSFISGDYSSLWMYIRYFDASMAYISSDGMSLTADITGDWQTFSMRSMPPEGAAYVSVRLRLKSNSSNYNWAYAFLDNVLLEYTSAFMVQQGTNECVTSSTNETLVPVSDGVLAGASASEPLNLVFVGKDTVSSLQRSTEGSPSTQTHVTVGTWMPTNVANFDLSRSTTLATNLYASNTWSWTSISQSEVVELFTGEYHDVYLTVHDADHDRSEDCLYVSNYYAGRIQIYDDDTEEPIDNSVYNMWVPNGDFEQGSNSWTISATTSNDIAIYAAAARDGSLGLMMSNTLSQNAIRMDGIEVVPGWDYLYEVDARALGDASTASVRMYWRFLDTNGAQVAYDDKYLQNDLTTDWQTFSAIFTAPTNAATVSLYILRGAGGNIYPFYFDNMGLRRKAPARWLIGDSEVVVGFEGRTNYSYVTDAQLATVDGATPLRLEINAYDEGSGLARSAAGTAATQMNVSVGSWVNSNIANYAAASSSTNSTALDTTNVWEWDSISSDFIDELCTTRTHEVSYTVIDSDHDRPDDELGHTNINGGKLVVIDDDEVAPRVSSMTFGGVTLEEYAGYEPLRAGDVMPIGWNTDGDGEIVFLLLVDVPAGTKIYIRDDELNAGNFTDSSEGTISWTAPVGGVPAGTVIEIDRSGNVNLGTGAVEDAGFNPANSSDQVYFYTAASWWASYFWDYNYLCAFETGTPSFNGDLENTWLVDGETALAFTSADNHRYLRAVTSGRVDDILDALRDEDNWDSSDGTGDQSLTLDTTPFSLNYQPLDIAVVGWNSDGDDEIAFLPLRDIAGAQVLYFRDDEWDDAWAAVPAFADSAEGTLQWTAPREGVPAGTVVVIDAAGNASAGTVEEIDAGFNIANSSDQVWIYTAPAWDTGPFKLRAAFETASSTFGGDLDETGLGEGTNVWAWGNSDNWRYDQSLTTCTRTELWAALQNSANWESTDGSGDQSYAFAADEYTLLRGRLDLTDADIGTLVLTGYVSDAVSGLIGGTGDNAPTVTIYNASGSVVAGSYLSGASDGDGTLVTAPVAFASSALNISGAFDVGYTAVVEFADYDQDRTRSGVNSDMRTKTELIAFTLRDDDTNRPNLYGFRFDDSLQPTDGEVADGLSITGLVQDASGIYSTTNATYRPMFSLFSPTNTVISLSNMNDRAITPDGGATTDTSIGQDSGSVQIPYDSRVLGTWTARVEVVDYDRDRVGDELTCTSNFVFTVVDDDTNAPDVSLVAQVTVGGVTRYVSGAGTDRVFQVTEGDMANLDTAPLEIILKPYDEHTGIARATAGPETNMSVSIASFITNDVAHFCASNSSVIAETQNSSLSSNIWQWDTPYGYTELGNLFGLTGWYSRILADIPDADDDRPDDMLWVSNRQFGFIQLVDDDTVSPTNYKLMDVYHVKNGTDFEDEASGGTSTNRIFTFSDGELRALSADTQLWFSIYARDVDSGFPRGTTGAATNMNISIPNFTTNNVANFSLASSGATTNSDASNVWAFTTALTYDEMTSLYGDYGCTNPILATLPCDSDNDRANDAMPGYTNWQLGFFAVTDDDVTGPQPRANITASFTNPALEVYLGGDGNLDGYSGTNVWQGRALSDGDTITNADERFVVTDEDLAHVASTNPFMLKAWFWDSASGLMGHGDSATNKSLSLGSAIVSNAEAFSPTYSVKSVSIDGSSRLSFRSTNYWVWTNFTYEQVGLLHTNSSGHSNTVVIHSWDADMDRANDQAHSNLVMGTLIVLDDDTNAPVAGALTPINLLRNSSFETQGSYAGIAKYWAWDEPDRFGGIWGNYLHIDWRAHSGDWEGTIPGQWGGHLNTSGGWWQWATNSYAAGTTWRAAMWVWSDATWSSAGSYLSIEFIDVDSNRFWGVTNLFATPGEEWTYVTVEGTSPVGCAFAQLEIGTWGMNTMGALQFDDAELGPYVPQAMTVEVGGSNVMAASGSGTNAVFTVSDGDLAGTTTENLLINEGFESNTLVGWMAFNYGTNCTWAAERGFKGYAFPAYVGGSPSWGNGGIYQDVTSVTEGDTYTFSMRACKETNFWAEYVQLKLEFRDGGGELATYTNNLPLTLLDDGWYGYDVAGVAPAGVTFLRVVAMYSGGTNDGPAASWLWDEASLVHQSSTGDGVQLRFSAFDENGMARGTTDPTTEMNVNIENWCDSDVHNYKAAQSTTILSNSGVSAWSWSRLDKATVSALYDAGTNRIAVDLYDGDDDRPFDGMDNTNQQFGFLHVIDDDTNGPVAQMIEIDWGPACLTNYLTDGKLHVGNFGITVTMEDPSSIMTNMNVSWMPDFSLVSPDGDTNLQSSSYDSYYPMTNATVIAAWRNWAGSVDYTNVQTGVWEVVWSAQDNDGDRYDDRSYQSYSRQVSSWSNVFVVVDDDTSTPTAPSNLVASSTYWTNINNFAFTWDPAVDDSGIPSDGYRVATNAAPLITDGSPMEGSCSTNIRTLTFNNLGFEIGDGQGGQSVGDDTYGWWNRSGIGGYGHFSNTEAQEGTNSMRVSCDSGVRPNGQPRYTLIQTYLPIDNTNDYGGIVEVSGWFNGDLSSQAYGDYCCAFIKIEYCDVSSNIIAPSVNNEYDDGHNGRPGYGINTGGNWSNIVVVGTNMPANTEYILATVGIGNNNSKLACYGYWDNVEVSVGLITPAGLTGASYTNAAEGSNTVYLYVVDDDNDRPGDQLMSSVTNFTIMYDATAPLVVTNIREGVALDDTSEIMLEWDALPDGGNSNLAPWHSYFVYYTEEDRNPTTNDAFFDLNNGPLSLATNVTGSATFSNFLFGETYRLAVAGADRAGNVSALSSSVVVTLAGFYLTQGVTRASADADLSWTATNSYGEIIREFDLLYVDAYDFSTALTSQWKLAGGVTNSCYLDEGGTNRHGRVRPHPQALTNVMRFYRASLHDMWRTNRSVRSASAEIYVLKNVILHPGQNWVQLPGIPDTNTVAFVMGTDLPAGPTAVSPLSTKISWYERGETWVATQEVGLVSGSPNHWLYTDTYNPADAAPVPLHEAFVVEIPTNAAQNYKVTFIGRVPTSAVPQTIKGTSRATDYGAHSLVAFNQPRRIHPAQLELTYAGFTGWGGWPPGKYVDAVWTWGAGQYASPKLTYRYGDWYNMQTWAKVPTNYFAPDKGLVIQIKNSAQDFGWTNPILYPAPHRKMNP